MISKESLITLHVSSVPNDQSKKYLFTAGSGKTLYLFKVDPLLKCASMPILQVETTHDNTISGLILYTLADMTFLATASIDKQVGWFKMTTPQTGKTMKPLNRGNWQGTQASTGSKLLSDYLNERGQEKAHERGNASCACFIF